VAITGGTINGTSIGATTPTTGVFSALTVNDNSTLGSSNSDTVNFNARVASDINPSTDNTYDLGVTGHEWRNLNIDGTANIDSLVADTADINGGTIDATAIGGSTAAAGAFTTASASTSVTTPSLTNAGTLALSATGANIITAATNGVERMRIDSAGDVGIGTTTPASRVHLFGGTGATTNYIVEPNGWFGLKHRFGVSYSGDTTVIANNSLLTSATAGTLDDTGNTGSAIILGGGGTLNFVQASAGAGSRTFTSRLAVDSSGNVGIGTASPAVKLDVAGTINSTGLAVTGALSSTGTISSTIASGASANQVITNAGDFISAFVGNSSTQMFSIRNNSATGVYLNTQNSIPLFLGVSTATTAGTTVANVAITSAGNVGIGTASPGSMLDVNGELRIGNTVAAAVAVASTHKVTIVIGGVTYYLLATNV
jgi:hypothetical protein